MSLDLQTVANRYARALFELADQQGELEQVHQELMSLREIFHANPRLATLLASIKLTLSQKESLVQALQQGASQLTTNLIQMVFDYGRMNAMVAIMDEFERRYDQQNKRVHADVVTAVQLDEPRRAQLKQNLLTRYGAKEIVLHETVDESILGGVIVTAQHKTLDGSLKSKIEQIRRLLVK